MQEKAPASGSAFDPLWATYWRQIQEVGPLTHTRYRLIFAELPALAAKPRILDVGCGSGTLLKLLGAKFPGAELSGVEVSEEACQLATPEIRSVISCGDIVQLASQFEPASFDLLVCSEVLEHVVDPDLVMRTTAKLLKMGGTAIFTVPAGVKHWSSQDDAAGHLRRFEVKDFAALISRCDLTLCNQYTWGGPVSTIYNRLISAVGPESAANAGRSAFVRMLAKATTSFMRLDDIFKSQSTTRFQLIASARKHS